MTKDVFNALERTIQLKVLGQREDFYRLYCGGNEDILLLDKGKLTDFVKLPFQLGLKNVRNKMLAWQTH